MQAVSETLETPVLMARVARVVQQARQVTPVLLVTPVTQALTALVALVVRQAMLVTLVLLVTQETQELTAQVVQVVLLVMLVTQVHQVPLVTPVELVAAAVALAVQGGQLNKAAAALVVQASLEAQEACPPQMEQAVVVVLAA
jgi:hypothetical protein